MVSRFIPSLSVELRRRQRNRKKERREKDPNRRKGSTVLPREVFFFFDVTERRQSIRLDGLEIDKNGISSSLPFSKAQLKPSSY